MCVCTIETAAGVAVCRLLEYCFIVGHDTLLATQSEQNYVSHRSPTQPVVIMLRFSLIISDMYMLGWRTPCGGILIDTHLRIIINVLLFYMASIIINL